MEKLNGKSFDVTKENLEKLKELFPEVYKDGEFDFNVIKELVGANYEEVQEKYNFTWSGKQQAIKEALKQSKGTLIPNKEKSVNFDTTNNIYIEGDNLEVLKLLQDSYRGKIKMIYIDPPYNTGSDFVYKDNYFDNLQSYLESTDQNLISNPESNGRFHTDWLNMMYPRLMLARNLLTENGVIFISIDDNEFSNLKKLSDEIFGENNFIVCIVWEKKFSPQNDAKYFSINHEYILCYSKDKSNFNRNLLEMTDEQVSRYTNIDNDPRGPWTSSDLTVARFTPKDVYEITSPSGKTILPTNGRSWGISRDKFKELQDDNRIWFGENGDNVPRLKRFLSEIQQGKVPISLFYNQEVGHTQEATKEVIDLFNGKKYFDYPKPVKLIKRLILIGTDKSDLILDFFSGSATTAHAVMQLNAEDGGNRKFIMVQLPEKTDVNSEAYKAGYKNICEIGEERIRRAGKKIKEEQGMLNEDLDIGFKVFELNTSNLKVWNEEKVTEETLLNYADSLIDGRTQLDLVYEITLKYGIDLTVNIEEKQILGKTIYNVGFNYLIICLDKDLDLSFIEEIGKLKPERVVFYDEGFKDDSVKINAEKTLERYGVTDIRVI